MYEKSKFSLIFVARAYGAIVAFEVCSYSCFVTLFLFCWHQCSNVFSNGAFVGCLFRQHGCDVCYYSVLHTYRKTFRRVHMFEHIYTRTRLAFTPKFSCAYRRLLILWLLWIEHGRCFCYCCCVFDLTLLCLETTFGAVVSLHWVRCVAVYCKPRARVFVAYQMWIEFYLRTLRMERVCLHI